MILSGKYFAGFITVVFLLASFGFGFFYQSKSYELEFYNHDLMHYTCKLKNESIVNIKCEKNKESCYQGKVQFNVTLNNGTCFINRETDINNNETLVSEWTKEIIKKESCLLRKMVFITREKECFSPEAKMNKGLTSCLVLLIVVTLSFTVITVYLAILERENYIGID